jgi:hypothetical protein
MKNLTPKQHAAIELVNIVVSELEIGNSRKRNFTDQRSALYNYLFYVHKMTKTDIGIVFNKDHATVLHGLKHYENMKQIKDSLFLLNIGKVEIMLLMEQSNFFRFELTLKMTFEAENQELAELQAKRFCDIYSSEIVSLNKIKKL